LLHVRQPQFEARQRSGEQTSILRQANYATQLNISQVSYNFDNFASHSLFTDTSGSSRSPPKNFRITQVGTSPTQCMCSALNTLDLETDLLETVNGNAIRFVVKKVHNSHAVCKVHPVR
jgi:hypothetical protein